MVVIFKDNEYVIIYERILRVKVVGGGNDWTLEDML